MQDEHGPPSLPKPPGLQRSNSHTAASEVEQFVGRLTENHCAAWPHRTDNEITSLLFFKHLPGFQSHRPALCSLLTVAEEVNA